MDQHASQNFLPIIRFDLLSYFSSLSHYNVFCAKKKNLLTKLYESFISIDLNIYTLKWNNRETVENISFRIEILMLLELTAAKKKEEKKMCKIVSI